MTHHLKSTTYVSKKIKIKKPGKGPKCGSTKRAEKPKISCEKMDTTGPLSKLIH